MGNRDDNNLMDYLMLMVRKKWYILCFWYLFNGRMKVIESAGIENGCPYQIKNSPPIWTKVQALKKSTGIYLAQQLQVPKKYHNSFQNKALTQSQPNSCNSMRRTQHQDQSYSLSRQSGELSKKTKMIEKNKKNSRYQMEMQMGQGLVHGHANGQPGIKKPRETLQIEKMYWLATIKYFMENKFQKISWGNTKPDKFFVKIEEYFEGKRNKVQIKSLDQRLKKKFYVNNKQKLDMIDAIKTALPEHDLSAGQQQILSNFIQKYDQQNTWRNQFIESLEKSTKEREEEYQRLKDMIRNWKILDGQPYEIQAHSQ